MNIHDGNAKMKLFASSSSVSANNHFAIIFCIQLFIECYVHVHAHCSLLTAQVSTWTYFSCIKINNLEFYIFNLLISKSTQFYVSEMTAKSQ